MERELLYIIGGPGSGKTTLVNELTRELGYAQMDRAFKYLVYRTDPAVVQLGAARGAFSGTDALSMSVQPAVEGWLSTLAAPELVLAEGDRLANGKFFDWAIRCGYRLWLFYLNTPPDIAADWRQQRADDLEIKLQSMSWVQGRYTKHANLAQRYHAHVIETTNLQWRVNQIHAVGSHVAQALTNPTEVPF